MLEVEILGITQIQGSGFPTVLLRHGDRVLLVSIGMPEAAAIQMALLNEKAPRPMTHDLICNLLAGLRGRPQDVTIYKLDEQTFFAYLTIEQQDEQGAAIQVLRVDARPSDGIAIALRLGCPIYVAEEVMDEAGHDAALLRRLFENQEEEEDEEGYPHDDEDTDPDDEASDDSL